MIKVGDKVVVTDIPKVFGLVDIGVGSVGEVVARYDETAVDIRFGAGTQFTGFDDEESYLESKNCGHNFTFLVEKVDNKEEKEVMLEVGDKVVVTEVVNDVLEGVELYKVGEIVEVDYCDRRMPYLVNFGDFDYWAGEEFLVEKVELVEESVSPPKGEVGGAEIHHSVNVIEDNGGEGFALGESFKTYIEEKQDNEESENTPEEGAYNTVIKKDGLTVYTNSTVIEKDGLTIYTNYSVEVVGEVMRVGGVDDLVSNFDESEDGGGELGEQAVASQFEG